MRRCDLQVHSCHSNRPTEWILRKLGVPESYTPPQVIYDHLKAKGFDWVTITDHNCIDGCLAIADREGVFLSEEVTTYFPEDGCKIHILAWNITEAQHREILNVRKNIYEFAAYLRAQNIVHGVAHPFLNINHRLKVEHLEKLALLFRVFERINGTRETLAEMAAEVCFGQLTPQKIEELANRHNLASTHDEPWRKSFVGGSDDHSGLYMGSAWTEVDDATDLKAYFEAVEKGRSRAAGQSASVMRISTGVYHIVSYYARDRLGKIAPKGMKLLSKMGERFLAGKNPTDISFREKMAHAWDMIKSGRGLDFLQPKELSLNREVALYLLDPKIKNELDEIIAAETEAERRTFRMAAKIVNDLCYRLFSKFMLQMNRGALTDSIQPLLGMLPLMAGLSPYLFAYHSVHGGRRFLTSAVRKFSSKIPREFTNYKRAWFTDTLEDVNGVARTICTMSRSASKVQAELTIITSRPAVSVEGVKIKNFKPVGEFEIPEYKLQKLSFPPILEMIDYIEREGFTECIISTPGPVGLTALCAARLLGLRVSGIYHTDFPQYVKILTDDHMLETVMWSYMQWFYAQMDLMYVNSNFYKTCWMNLGVPENRLQVLPRGIDTELFNPKHHNPSYWKCKGARGAVLLYVGRISKEKELGFLAEIYQELKRRKAHVSLALVGDGPYVQELKELLPDAIFTGIITGQELGVAYASADLFLFPSTTDTFGNVVIEAQASGLPAFVSDLGGPMELIRHEHEGRILPAGQLHAWVEAVEGFIRHPISRSERLQRVEVIQSERSWDEAFRQFWQTGEES